MDVARRRFLGGRGPGPAPFRPPWSVAEPFFLDRCTRCNDCLKACPTQLLVAGQGGYPEADFSDAHCTLCGDCARVCSTGAIGRDVEQTPWSFGIAIGDGCLAAQNVECRVCGELCDAGAIRFRPRLGGVPLPDVDNTACSGCGACIAPCPVVAIQRVAVNPAQELS
ncbi:MAG: ferredoxin-type protein NapF [Zoogloea sp.]|uniref:ferredoxin-type protein NapF n=1 Tax=Zoogloea sp. TaxID=49181 RepID=UPI002618613D|nr:ferredoxin-type protein NapF [Zoogloea sp.]MDD2990760.1 ferredoxin-type protein NapF [Zoogloea sp.]